MRTKSTVLKALLLSLNLLCLLNTSLKAQAFFHVMSVSGNDIKNLETNNGHAAVVLEFKTNNSLDYYLIASIYNEGSRKFTSLPLTIDTINFLKPPYHHSLVLSSLVKWFKEDTISINQNLTYFLNPYLQGDTIKYQFSQYKETYLISQNILFKIQIKHPDFKQVSISFDSLYVLYNKRYITSYQLKKILGVTANVKDFNPIPPKKVGN